MTARKKYSKEFKLDAMALMVEQKHSRVEVAMSLGLSPQIHGRWLKEAKSVPVMLFEVILLWHPSKRKFAV